MLVELVLGRRYALIKIIGPPWKRQKDHNAMEEGGEAFFILLDLEPKGNRKRK